MNIDYGPAEGLYRAWLNQNGLHMRRFRIQALEALIMLGISKRFYLEDFLRVWKSSIASRPSAYRVLEELVKSGVLHRTTAGPGSGDDYLWEFSESATDAD